jgi:hypothetical protein
MRARLRARSALPSTVPYPVATVPASPHSEVDAWLVTSAVDDGEPITAPASGVTFLGRHPPIAIDEADRTMTIQSGRGARTSRG